MLNTDEAYAIMEFVEAAIEAELASRDAWSEQRIASNLPERHRADTARKRLLDLAEGTDATRLSDVIRRAVGKAAKFQP